MFSLGMLFFLSPRDFLSVSMALEVTDRLHVLLCYQRWLHSHTVRKCKYTGYRQRHFSDWL